MSQTHTVQNKVNLSLPHIETYRGGSSGGSRVGETADVGLGSGADHGVRDVGNLSYGAHGCWWFGGGVVVLFVCLV